MKRLTGPVAPAVLFAIATRIALAFAVWITGRSLPKLGLYPAQLPDSFLPDHPALDGWARWDAAHYVALARFGYSEANPSDGDGLGFLPLFPLLMRGLARVSGSAQTDAAYAVAGIALANICFVIAVALFARLSGRILSGHTAVYPVMLLCLMPYSFFLNAAYSESLFLVIVLVSLVLAMDGKWLGAGAIAALASLTRLAGLALAPALFWGAWKDGVRGWRLIATGLLPFGGFAAYSLYTAIWHDDAFAYFTAQEHWGGWDEHVRFYAELFVRSPGEAIGGDPRHLVIVLNLIVGLVFLALLPLAWKRLPPAIAMFTVVTVIAHLLVTWVSLGRYLLPSIGIYLVLGAIVASPRWSGWARDALFACLAILLATLTILFSRGFWVV
ncbi:MAG: mannosyltransferase family protein [Thermomicrobiales bacterium]